MAELLRISLFSFFFCYLSFYLMWIALVLTGIVCMIFIFISSLQILVQTGTMQVNYQQKLIKQILKKIKEKKKEENRGKLQRKKL
jgi:hypothetical protein